ncbi:MAG: hypothetical protein ACE15C_16365 [Phycisphaerae bacterium]
MCEAAHDARDKQRLSQRLALDVRPLLRLPAIWWLAAVTARAALAKADAAKYLKAYQEGVEQLLNSPVEGYEGAKVPWEQTFPERMQMLGWCANVHYVPYIAGQLRPMLAQGISEYGFGEIAAVLCDVGADDLGDALAGQLDRPCPLGVKIALAETAGRMKVPGLDKALERWAKSKVEQLSSAAKAAQKKFAQNRSAASRPAAS